MSAVTDTNSTISQRKLELLELNQNFIDRLKRTREGVECELDAAIGFFRQQAETVRLILMLDGERIIGSKVASQMASYRLPLLQRAISASGVQKR